LRWEVKRQKQSIFWSLRLFFLFVAALRTRKKTQKGGKWAFLRRFQLPTATSLIYIFIQKHPKNCLTSDLILNNLGNNPLLFTQICNMNQLLSEIRACTICQSALPLGPHPIIQASKKSRLLLIGQAPGAKVHASGVPWDDASGNNLRQWLGLDKTQFYDAELIALMPMGFCYPGAGKSGDLPPRPECAPTWHQLLLDQMPNIELTILIGQYAQNRYLGNKMSGNLTETVRNWHTYFPLYLPLPHPSPRNQIWMRKNPWFEQELLPVLKEKVAALCSSAQ